MKSGIELISEERQRQIEQEGWTPEYDDQHHQDELARAAAVYALPQWVHERLTEIFRSTMRYGIFPNILWPWDQDWYKPTPDDRTRELVKAGALIAAEIDRLQRQKVRIT